MKLEMRRSSSAAHKVPAPGGKAARSGAPDDTCIARKGGSPDSRSTKKAGLPEAWGAGSVGECEFIGIMPLTNPERLVKCAPSKEGSGFCMRKGMTCLLFVLLGSCGFIAGQNVQSEKIQSPRIVATVNLFNVTGPTSGTVFTPNTTGVYRFSAETVAHNTDSLWNVAATWNDKSGGHTARSTCQPSCGNAGGPEFLSVTMRVPGNSPIGYSVTLDHDAPTNDSCDLVIIVEQLE
jgi:hypothetical protein